MPKSVRIDEWGNPRVHGAPAGPVPEPPTVEPAAPEVRAPPLPPPDPAPPRPPHPLLMLAFMLGGIAWGVLGMILLWLLRH